MRRVTRGRGKPRPYNEADILPAPPKLARVQRSSKDTCQKRKPHPGVQGLPLVREGGKENPRRPRGTGAGSPWSPWPERSGGKRNACLAGSIQAEGAFLPSFELFCQGCFSFLFKRFFTKSILTKRETIAKTHVNKTPLVCLLYQRRFDYELPQSSLSAWHRCLHFISKSNRSFFHSSLGYALALHSFFDIDQPMKTIKILS